jgi:hydrogenase large subunit
MSDWGNNSPGYFGEIKSALSNFVSAGQLGIFGNAYWGHPAYKLPPELNLILFAHYLEALDWQRRMVKIHALFGGRNPHPNFVIGGTPCAISADATGVLADGNTTTDPKGLDLIRTTLRDMQDFVSKVHLPDLLAVARLYPDWFTRGEGLGNFLTFGDFPQDDNGSWDPAPPRLAIPKGAILWPRDARGRRLPMKQFRLADHVYPVDLKNKDEIQEFVGHTWLDYQAGKSAGLHPFDGETVPNYTGPKEAYAPRKPLCEGGQTLYDPSRAPEYSWLKTPRWNGKAMEVGALARIAMLYATDDANTQGLVNDSLAQLKQPLSALFSTMGRLLAEGLDTRIVSLMTKDWYDELVRNIKGGDLATHNPALFDPSTWPSTASGVGFTEAPRGALGHWVKIENGKIANYQTVVPTTWNAAPRDPSGQPSAYEAALQDGQHKLAVADQPLEILRTIHSFNPCMACAVHVIDTTRNESLRVTVQG